MSGSRVCLVDAKGFYLYPPTEGRYILEFGLGRFTGAVTTGAVFAMRNGTTKLMSLHKLHLQTSFSGTTAATSQLIHVKRFTTATHSGGSSILTTLVKNSTSMPTSTLLDARVADITGTSPLTDTGVVYGGCWFPSTFGRTAGGHASIIWSAEPGDEMLLLPSEGLALIIAATAVMGDTIVGSVEWDEVTPGAGNIGGPT